MPGISRPGDLLAVPASRSQAHTDAACLTIRAVLSVLDQAHLNGSSRAIGVGSKGRQHLLDIEVAGPLVEQHISCSTFSPLDFAEGLL